MEVPPRRRSLSRGLWVKMAATSRPCPLRTLCSCTAKPPRGSGPLLHTHRQTETSSQTPRTARAHVSSPDPSLRPPLSAAPPASPSMRTFVREPHLPQTPSGPLRGELPRCGPPLTSPSGTSPAPSCLNQNLSASSPAGWQPFCDVSITYMVVVETGCKSSIQYHEYEWNTAMLMLYRNRLAKSHPSASGPFLK